MNFNYELTDAQKAEFQNAEQFGGSSAEIRKHPEWHPNFMNSFWNREKEGTAENYYEIADYIASHPSKKDIESGKIGADFDYLYALHDFMKKAGPAGIPFPEIPLDDDGCVDTTMAKFMLQDTIYRFVEHREPLYTGRMPILLKHMIPKVEYREPLYTGRMPISNNNNTEDLKCLMCEGNAQAATIYDQLQKAAKSESRIVPDIRMSSYEQQRWNGFITVLSMDDMNIRGQQIVDAYEYANGSVETMLDLLTKRDPEMVGYVNQKMAKRYLDDSNNNITLWSNTEYPMAKTGGASSAHSGHFNASMDWYVTISNAEELAIGIPKIEDTPFAKFVPWIDKEYHKSVSLRTEAGIDETKELSAEKKQHNLRKDIG